MSCTLELLAPTGLTLSVQLYPYGSDTIANGVGGDSLTEATNRKGLYTATIAEAITGWHTAHVFLSGTVIAAGDVYLIADEVCRVRDASDWLRRLAEAQNVIDQTTTPWQLVLKDRDSDAELLRFDLKDADGANIDSIETFVAEQTTPP